MRTTRTGAHRPLGAVVVLLGLLVALVAGALPASAHGGPIDVDVADDGTGALSLVATWREDGHMVGPEVDFTATATGPDDRVVDGIVFELRPEGEGFRTSTTQLAEGEWQLDLRAAGGSDATFEVAVTSGGPALERTPAPSASPDAGAPSATTAPTPSATAAEVDAEPAAGTGAADDGADGGPGAGTVALVLLAVVLLAAAALLLRARSRRSTP